MENFAQIETIKQKIHTASTAAIAALHKFIFEEEGDRRNRQCLRDFSGFTFYKDTSRYADKFEFGRRLSIGDLISCCNILGLEYNGTKEEIVVRILDGLLDINILAITHDENYAEEKDEEDDKVNEEVNDVEEDKRSRGKTSRPEKAAEHA